jgi:hypothetical protein
MNTRDESHPTHSNISQHRLFFDAEGRLVRRLFEPVGGGTTVADSSGVYGRLYSYGPLGLATSVRNLDASGDVLIDRLGVAEIRREYDGKGRAIKVSWHDAGGAFARQQPERGRGFL